MIPSKAILEGSNHAFRFSFASALAAIFICTAASSHAQDALTDCHSLADTQSRLSCYDQISGFDVAQPIENNKTDQEKGGQWTFSSETSALDGTTDVWLSVISTNREPNQIGNPEQARFWLRCMNNSTNALITFNDYTTDDQFVRYRIDDGEVQTVWMSTMRGGDGIGIWAGGGAIAFAKSLLDHTELVVGYRSYSNDNLEFSFDVTGLRSKLTTLAETCNWTF